MSFYADRQYILCWEWCPLHAVCRLNSISICWNLDCLVCIINSLVQQSNVRTPPHYNRWFPEIWIWYISTCTGRLFRSLATPVSRTPSTTYYACSSTGLNRSINTRVIHKDIRPLSNILLVIKYPRRVGATSAPRVNTVDGKVLRGRKI